MKKITLILLIFSVSACGGKKKTADKPTTAALKQRLTEFLQYNDELNISKLLDYIYPKLFTLVPRADMEKAMKDGFESEELKVDLENVKADSLYPVFTVGKANYAKVRYSMVMWMEYKKVEESSNPAAQVEAMQEMMANKYGPENVQVDAVNGKLKINSVNNQMLALQDSKDQPWYFLNLKKDDPLMQQLVSKEVIDSLAAYQ